MRIVAIDRLPARSTRLDEADLAIWESFKSGSPQELDYFPPLPTPQPNLRRTDVKQPLLPRPQLREHAADLVVNFAGRANHEYLEQREITNAAVAAVHVPA